MLAGDPAAADPVCDKSPHHGVVLEALARAEAGRGADKPLVFRDPANSRRNPPTMPSG